MEAKGRAQGGNSAHRFYISSPFLGLKKEREEAKKLITRRNHAYGDSYGGSPDPLVETCQRDVRASDHYILILGERYGTRRPMGIGTLGTAAEGGGGHGCGGSRCQYVEQVVLGCCGGPSPPLGSLGGLVEVPGSAQPVGRQTRLASRRAL